MVLSTGLCSFLHHLAPEGSSRLVADLSIGLDTEYETRNPRNL